MIAHATSPLGAPGSTLRRHRAAALALGVTALALSCWLAAFSPFSADAASSEPGVVLILTDDQTLEEMSAMPQTRSLIGDKGVTFNRAYISYPLCCPSRASILSGQYMHNNGVRGNSKPDGGWARFADSGLETQALPTWTEAAGYENVLIGKYMNGYGPLDAPIPPGWEEWYGKVSEYNETVYGASIYFNYNVREDPPVVGGAPCPSGESLPPGTPFTCTYGQDASEYQTDVFRDMAVEAIGRLAAPAATSPFFLSVDFNAPHSPYIPAPRHAGVYANAAIEEPIAENEEDMRDKPRFLRRLPMLGKGKLVQIEKRRRARLEMLMSVDDGVAAIVKALEDEGQLDNTYLIFMSDNGYFAGEHRIRQGKYLPHEPSSHVPMMIRGPGIPAGAVSNELVSNVDIAPTIAAITGATPAIAQDGRSLLPYAEQPTLRSGRPILLEGDTGQAIDDEGGEGPGLNGDDPADAARLRKFKKKVKAQKRKLKHRCQRLNRNSPRRSLLCFKRGVANIEQEPTDKSYKLHAPAYAGLRTDRYALFLYSTGELELYDMALDPFQMSSLHKNRRYRPVRKYLLARLAEYKGCAAAGCLASIGTEPLPLKKTKKTKQKKQKQKQKEADTS